MSDVHIDHLYAGSVLTCFQEVDQTHATSCRMWHACRCCICPIRRHIVTDVEIRLFTGATSRGRWERRQGPKLGIDYADWGRQGKSYFANTAQEVTAQDVVGRHSLIWAMYIGTCGPEGYGFSAVLVINRISILADFGHFDHIADFAHK